MFFREECRLYFRQNDVTRKSAGRKKDLTMESRHHKDGDNERNTRKKLKKDGEEKGGKW